MITKTVTSGQRSATATISEETKFIFSDMWNYFHVQNLGTGTVYIGMSAGVTAGNDGVIAIPSGGTACTMHNFPADSVYILSTASDLVQVVGSNSAFIPFKQGSSGGGGSAYILPKATANSLGGIQAKAKTTENTEAAIGTDNKMYVYVPTALSELSNDENFIKNTVDNLVNYYNKTNSYSKTEINTLISNLNSLTTEIVVSLPTENISTSTIYLIQVESTNNYVQWMYINSAWANLGSTEINLTNYYTKLETYSKTETDSLLSQKVDTVDGKGLSTNDFTTVLKNKLDGIAEGANNYTLPVATTSTLGGVKVDGTSITIADGVISASGGGGGVTVDSALSDTSTNPVQNKVVNAALADKSNLDHIQAADKGGTGQTSYTVGDILYADTTTTLAKLAAGTAGQVLKSGGAGTAPAWADESGGGGSTYILPKATETTLGGIKAKNRTTETGECAIDPETGKIYAPASSSNAVTIYSGTFNRDGMTLSQAYTDFTYLLFTINYYNSTYSSRQLSSMLVKTSDIVAAANNNIVIPYVVEIPPPAGDTSPLYKSFYFYSTTVIRSRSVADSNITVIIRGIN